MSTTTTEYFVIVDGKRTSYNAGDAFYLSLKHANTATGKGADGRSRHHVQWGWKERGMDKIVTDQKVGDLIGASK